MIYLHVIIVKLMEVSLTLSQFGKVVELPSWSIYVAVSSSVGVAQFEIKLMKGVATLMS